MGRPKSASKTGPTPRVTRGGVAKAAQKAKAAKAKAKATRRAKAKARETAAPAHVALRPALEAAEFRAGSKAPSTRRTRRGAERTVLDMLLVSPEGRAVWANVVAPLLGHINQALLARACRSGRDLRRAVAGDQPVGKLQARELLAHPDLIPLAEAALGVGLYTWNFSRGIDENGAWYTYHDGVQWRTVQYPRWTRPDFSGWNLRRAMESAARWGCLDALKWMREHRHGSCCMDQHFMGKAAEGGQIAVLEWLIDNNLPFMNACVHAAENNHLEALEYMVSRDEPWSGGVCRTAAWCGHLEVLKWAVANGCPGFSERWFELCIDAAELNGHDHVLEWLAEQAEAGNIPPPGPEDEYLD